jgi:short-subunit dehydrogenase
MRQIRGKKALVTGAAAGIGRALTLRLADEGADLFMLDVDETGLREVVAEAQSRGVQAVGCRCDLSSSAEISRSVQQLLETWGTLDILVNNAGVCYYGATGSMTAQQLKWLMDINLQAPLQLIHELLPTLLSRPEGHILNVASMYGLVATARCTVYHASKFGLVGFSEALRAELARQGVDVSTLCPGFVQTEFFEKMPCDRGDGNAPRPPAWLCSTPEQVANAGIRAIRRNQGLALVGKSAYFAYYVKRLCPGLMGIRHAIERWHKRRARRGPKTSESQPRAATRNAA